jgi:FlgD Ig-like domain
MKIHSTRRSPHVVRLARSHRSRAALLAGVLLLAAAFAPSRVDATAPFFIETIESGGFIGEHISLALDDAGTPHVAYWDLSNFFLMYATRVDGAWTTEIIEASVYLGTDISIAVDPQGVPHVAFYEGTASGGKLRYASRTAGTWTIEDVDATVTNVGQYCALAIDSNGRPHISYQDVTNVNLKYAVKNGTWSREIVVPGGEYTDLALDGSDLPHISFLVGGQLSYARKVGSTWYVEYVPIVAAIDRTGIALGPNGAPHIAATLFEELFVLVWNGSLWTTEPVPSVTKQGIYDGAMAMDGAGRPHVAYRSSNSNNHDLWYAFAGSSWDSTRVTTVGATFDVGHFNDLALDGAGNPVIAYQDGTNGDAMYADAGVKLSTALAGVTWPVGAERTLTWRGAGTVDIDLSTDGGATFHSLATGLTGGNLTVGGQHTFTVPHTPSHFCKVRLSRQTPFATSVSESLFTIETSVSLLSMLAARIPDRPGAALVSWRSDPGPEELAGYRLEKAPVSGAWRTLVPLTSETSFTDVEAGAAARYRLFAVNGLGEELLLGEAALRPLSSLTAWPAPYRGGSLTVSFATYGGLGGGSGSADVSIFDVRGRRVRTISRGSFAAGYQTATWDGRDAGGRDVPAGVYFIRSRTAGQERALKFTVLR